MMHVALTEKQVLEIWQDSLQSQTDLMTEKNEPVRIVYPGRLNDDRGADLKDAVIATRHGLLKGDIEIHRQTSHWWEHGHHRDATYNSVILHVVYHNNSANSIVLQNGDTVPTVTLHDYVKTARCHNHLAVIPCRNVFFRENIQSIAEILDIAGEQRFLTKSTFFEETKTKVGASQALYKGIMTALGYSKNKEPMAELAERLPLKRLEALASANIPALEYLARCQTLLIGTAGLLPSQRDGGQKKGEFENKLEKIWSVSSGNSPMRQSDWRLFKVRPGNHPIRRLAAMSHLLVRYRENGLLASLEEKLCQAMKNNNGHFLEEALLVAPDDYWSHYLDFGVPACGSAPALLGRERAREIIINILLPFMFARGPANTTEKALAVYRGYAAPAENTLVKHMRRQLGVTKAFIATARRQQGLIHIYKTLCSQGRCNECPLNI